MHRILANPFRNFAPLSVPKQQTTTGFTYHRAEASLPWRGVWEITQAMASAGVVRFVADLGGHIRVYSDLLPSGAAESVRTLVKLNRNKLY